MSEFDDLRNKEERKAEAKFGPDKNGRGGYIGPRWGEFTPGKTSPPALPRRLQVAFTDGSAYWLDVPDGSLLPGDQVMLFERIKPLTVQRTGIALPGDYFERKPAHPEGWDTTKCAEKRCELCVIPHKFGTFIQLIRKAAQNG